MKFYDMRNPGRAPSVSAKEDEIAHAPHLRAVQLLDLGDGLVQVLHLVAGAQAAPRQISIHQHHAPGGSG